MSAQGLHARRLSAPGGSADREQAFAKAWADSPEILHDLLGVPCAKDDEGAFYTVNFGWYKKPIGDVTPRDEQIAATLVQWFGTNVGFCFIEETLKKAGYGLVRKAIK